MGAGKAAFGLIALILPVGMFLFGIVVAALVGWRNWFGVYKDDKRKPPRDDGDVRY